MSVYEGSMRRDAVMRSRQMYGREAADVPTPVPTLPETEISEPARSVSAPKPSKRPAGILGGIFPDGIDTDTLLIAALLLLLLKEGGDIKLILALGYILL